MTKAFSLASWNVEHFKDDPTRVGRVVKFLNDQGPDVFGLYEVEGKTVFASMVKQMPGYQFHITEGPQTQEILVGARKGFTAFFTQKLEFKSGNPTLRPGALVTLTIDGKNYSLLFLHTKSSAAPVGLGLRDDMFGRAFKFKRKVLDKAAGGPVLGAEQAGSVDQGLLRPRAPVPRSPETVAEDPSCDYWRHNHGHSGFALARHFPLVPVARRCPGLPQGLLRHREQGD